MADPTQKKATTDTDDLSLRKTPEKKAEIEIERKRPETLHESIRDQVHERLRTVTDFYKLPEKDQVNFLIDVLEQNEKLKTKLEALMIDPVTGLHSRHYYESAFHQILALKRRNTLERYKEEGMELEGDKKDKFSMILFDLDYFKKVNDTYGHLAGDFVLGEVGRMIHEVFGRESDIKARYGGEEMVVVLPECDLDDAREKAEELRMKVAEKPLIYKGEEIPVTISAGVATLDLLKMVGKLEDLKEHLIKRADEALYAAKEWGRNRVVTEFDKESPSTATTSAESTS